MKMAEFTYKMVVRPRQLLHWGPIIALSVIFMISFTGMRCLLMWWPLHTPGGVIHLCIYCMWMFLVLYNYLLSAFKGPGFVPKGWRPETKEEEGFLQYCEICEGFKSPRSHHCRKCDRCVMKMDHHCPWINTCCGHYNHASFVYFLMYAPIGCTHAAVVLGISTYKALNWHYYMYYTDDPIVQLGFVGFIMAMFAIGLAIGVFIAVGMLFIIQMKSIIKNESGIESWIIEKALDRDRDPEEEEFIYPYNFGCWKNLQQVFTTSGMPKSNGITWPVQEGCNQYTLTIEQIQQKALKRERTLEYFIIDKFSGSWVPLNKGCRVCLNMPCTDEPRIAVTAGDKVLVTRWKKRWLYGTKLVPSPDKKGKMKRLRGWFPRSCAKELLMEDGEEVNTNHNHNDIAETEQQPELGKKDN